MYYYYAELSLNKNEFNIKLEDCLRFLTLNGSKHSTRYIKMYNKYLNIHYKCLI